MWAVYAGRDSLEFNYDCGNFVLVIGFNILRYAVVSIDDNGHSYMRKQYELPSKLFRFAPRMPRLQFLNIVAGELLTSRDKFFDRAKLSRTEDVLWPGD